MRRGSAKVMSSFGCAQVGQILGLSDAVMSGCRVVSPTLAGALGQWSYTAPGVARWGTHPPLPEIYHAFLKSTRPLPFRFVQWCPHDSGDSSLLHVLWQGGK